MKNKLNQNNMKTMINNIDYKYKFHYNKNTNAYNKANLSLLFKLTLIILLISLQNP